MSDFFWSTLAATGFTLFGAGSVAAPTAVVAQAPDAAQEAIVRAQAMLRAKRPAEVARGLALLRTWAERGDSRAMLNLASALGEAGGPAYDRAAALVWARRSVAATDVWAPMVRDHANLALATILLQDATAADGRGAIALLVRLVESGFAEALPPLSSALDRGVGRVVPPNPALATSLHRKAAEAGDVGAMVSYADRLAAGLGTPGNGQEALRWHRKAIEEAGADGSLELIKLLRAGGPGLEPRPTEAAQMAEKLAIMGDGASAAILGEMYARGEGRPRDDKTARGWLESACRSGEADPELLGDLHAGGRGGPVDQVKAHAYYALCRTKTGHAKAEALWASFDAAARSRARDAARTIRE